MRKYEKIRFRKRTWENYWHYEYAEKLENLSFASFIAEYKANQKILAEEHEREQRKYKEEIE